MHFEHMSKDLMSVHVWRQTQTQSTIINFYEGDMNIFKPQRNDRGDGDGVFKMEFPLMQWLVAILYRIFGNHILITRIAMLIIGFASVIGIYRFISTLFENEKMALIGAWTFSFSPCFYYYTINPMPDNLALCCSIWGLVFFFLWYRKPKYYLLLQSGLFLSVGTLCKLPFVIYFIVPLGYFFSVLLNNKNKVSSFFNLIGISAFIMLPLTWYMSVIPQWKGNGIVSGILDNKDSFSKISGYFIHNLISTLPELLLNYGSLLFFIMGFYYLIKHKAYKHPLFPICATWGLSIIAYFVFEINMIADVHDYYLFPFLPILFILVSYGAFYMYANINRQVRYIAIIIFLILPFTAFLRMQGRWSSKSPGFNKDLLIYKNELRNAVPKNELCIAGNDISHSIFFYYIDKKGWGFENDDLYVDKLKNMIANGARYLYSDSRAIDEDIEIQKLFEKMILEKGTIRIYSLKNGEGSKGQ